MEPTANTPGDEHESPQERIERAIMELNECVSAELLDLIHQASPQFFESLVLDLLHTMGYGTSRSDLQRIGLEQAGSSAQGSESPAVLSPRPSRPHR